MDSGSVLPDTLGGFVLQHSPWTCSSTYPAPVRTDPVPKVREPPLSFVEAAAR